MGPLRKSLSVRLRALVHRWFDEQDEAGEATTGSPGPERERQPGLFGGEGGL